MRLMFHWHFGGASPRHRAAVLLLLAMTGMYFFSYFYRVAVPGTVFDELQTEFAASAKAITALGAVFLYTYGAIQVFAGLLADRFGGVRTLLAGSLIMTGAGLAFPLAHSLEGLVFTRVLQAVGASVIFISIVKELDTLFDASSFAVLLGGVLLLGFAGGLVGTWPLEWAVRRVGWRPAMLAAAGLCGGALLLAALAIARVRPVRRVPVARRLYLRAICRNPDTWPILITGALNFGLYFLFQAALGKKLLTDCGGLSSGRAAAVMFAMMLVSMGGASLAGWASRLIGNRRKPLIHGATWLIVVVLTAAALACRRTPPPGPLLTAALLLLSLGASMSPLVSAVIKEVNPAAAAATAIGLCNGGCYLAIAALTNLSGVVLDAFAGDAAATATAVRYPPNAYAAILLGGALLAGVSALSAGRIRETRGQCRFENRSF